MVQRQYLITSTSLNKQFNKAKTNMVKIIHRTKLEVYLDEINSATTKRVCLLLATVNAWTKIQFTNINTIVQLPAIFYDFYLNKLRLIRNNIDQHRTVLPSLRHNLHLENFHPVTISQLHAMTKNSKHTYLALVPIETSLQLECLDDILLTLAHVIDNSIFISNEHINPKAYIDVRRIICICHLLSIDETKTLCVSKISLLQYFFSC